MKEKLHSEIVAKNKEWKKEKEKSNKIWLFRAKSFDFLSKCVYNEIKQIISEVFYEKTF